MLHSLALALTALVAATAPLLAQKKPNPKPAQVSASMRAEQAKKLAAEWLNDETADAAKKKERAKALAALEPAHLVAPLREGLKVDAKRERAIELVVALRHPQAFELLKPILETEQYRTAIDALLACGDRASDRGLRELWIKEPAESERMEHLTTALAASGLRPESVRYFATECIANRRLPHSRRIATQTLELDQDAPVADVQKALAKFDERAKLYARSWKIEGTALALPRGRWFDDNVQCGADARLEAPLPDWCQDQDHTVVIRILPLEKDKVSCGYQAKEGYWAIEMKEGTGQFKQTPTKDLPTTMKPGVWSEVRFVLRADPKRTERAKTRLVEVLVDGKPVPGTLSMDGELLFVFVNGRCVVGGWCVVKN